jgi:hypothetical protein
LPALYEPPPLEADLLPPVVVRLRVSIFREEFRQYTVEPLLTVQEIIARSGVVVPDRFGALVTIHGRKVPAEWHSRMRPKPGAIVNIAVLPQNQRAALMIGASLAIAVTAGAAAPLVAGGLTAAGVAGGLATVGGAVAAGAIALGGELTLDATK